MVAAREREGVARECPLPGRERRARGAEYLRPNRHAESPIFYSIGDQWPGLHYVSSTGECDEHLGPDDSGALDGDQRKRSAVRSRGWFQLPGLASGSGECAFAAVESGADPGFSALAAARGGWQRDETGIPNRSDSRSDGLQQQSEIWIA